MTIDVLLDDPFFTGASTSVDVPGRYDCALDGLPFMMDDKHDAFKGGISTIPLLRSQADNSAEPGESSTNPEDLWPRSQHSWHKGAGQQWLDIDDGDHFRFWNSRGVDPWTRGQIKTLGGTLLLEASTNTNLRLETAGNYVYFADGQVLKWYADITTSTAGTSCSIHNGETASSIKSICSDGYNVYAAVTDGVHKTTRAATTSSHYSDLQADTVAWAKGRLMASKGASLYNITTSGAAPATLFTHPTSDWQWTCFAEGTTCIYAAGYAGDKSVIYSITIKDDGTGLDVPKVAGELPDGEIVRDMAGYLGYLCIGTDKGRRLAAQNINSYITINAYLTIGALNPTPSPVLCFEPQDRFVWYGWTNFDSSFTGLGRMDLSTFTDTNVPAYASDLMFGSITPGFEQQGIVQDVVTSHNVRVFVVAGKGIVKETPSPSTTDYPYVETSEITYGVPDDKVALKLAIEHELLQANQYVTAYISVDGGDYTLVDTSNKVGTRHPSEPFAVDQVTGSTYRLKFALYREGVAPTVLNRYTLRAFPIPDRGRTIVVPFLLHEHFYDANGTECRMDPREARAYITALAAEGRLVQYQELATSYPVSIADTQFERHSRTQSGQTWNGTLVCKLKVF